MTPGWGKSNQLVVTNTCEVVPLFDGHNVLAVVQGHSHIIEVARFKGIPYVTGGAVCGNWWHGTHLGTSEGLDHRELAKRQNRLALRDMWFSSVDPQNTWIGSFRYCRQRSTREPFPDKARQKSCERHNVLPNACAFQGFHIGLAVFDWYNSPRIAT